MVDVVARLKVKGKLFEIMVDCDKAIESKKSKNVTVANMRDILAIDLVFSDYKKGLKVSSSDLKEAFGDDNVNEVAAKIVREGEIVLPQEYREKEREQKFKQIVDFLVKNSIDPRTNAPYTSERISSVLKEAGARVDETRSADEQALNIIKQIEKKIPIRIATIKLKIVIPAAHTGKAYGMLQKFNKTKEEWLSDGSLSCIIDLPAGMQMEFYDKLNAITHGSATTEEIKE
ncbi:MAG: ribosome assembly factor SBDS [Candidatus Pacearchaeota archaeon]|nr:MAG: ribosome assembly factor SBDS [Candidatus Pacearchaeota archaeon]